MPKAKILIVEDNNIEAMDLEGVLVSWGYKVPSIVSSGEEAVNKTVDIKPNLILMDILLKGDMDGVDAAKKIKDLTDIPIIYLTAYSDEKTLQKAKITEPYSYILKPFDVKELKFAIEMALYRHKMDKKLRESEKRLQLLYERVPLPYHSLNEDGYLVEVNQAWLETLGYSREEVIGHWFGEFLSPEYVDHFNKNFLLFKAAGEIHSAEFEMVRKDGSGLNVSFDGKIGYDEFGNFKQTHCIFHDITERKQIENIVQQNERKYRELFNNISSGVAIYEATKNGEDFIFKDFNHAAEKIDKIKKEEVIGRSVIEIFPRVKDFGIFEVFQRVWRTGNPEHFPISMYKDQRITGWRNNYVYKLPTGELVAVYDDVTERKKAEEALKESEKEYRQIVETASEGIWAVDADYKISFVNETMAEMLGYHTAEMIGRSVTDFMFEEDLPAHQARMKARRQGISERYERRFRHKDGSEIWTLASARALLDKKGKFAGSFAMFADVTERKLVENALRASEENYRRIVETANEGIWVCDDEDKTTFINQKMTEILGYKPEEMIGKFAKEFMYEEDLPAHQARMKARRQGISERYERRFRHKNGNEIWALISASALMDDEGKFTGSFSMFTDITERKKAEEELQESEAKLKIAMDLAKLVHWEYDVDSDMFTFDDQFYKLYGTSADQEGGTKMSSKVYASKFIPPEESSVVAEEIAKVLEIDDPNYSGLLEHRIIRADGEERYIVVRYGIVKDADGRTIKTFGANQDITDRKKMENTIRESETYYRTIFENTGTATVIVEEDTTISLANTEFERLSGYPREEIVGKKSWTEFVVKEDLKKMKKYHDRRRVDPMSIPKNYDFHFIDRYGNVKDIFLTIDVIAGTNKSIASLLDVTDRKQAEKALKESEEKYRLLVETAAEGIILFDKKGKVIEINEMALELSGLKREEVVGKNFIKMLPKVKMDPKEILTTFKNVMLGKKVEERVWTLTKPNGEKISFIGHYNYIKKEGKIIGLSYILEDLTDRIKAQKELQESEEKYRTLFELGPVYTILIGADGKILDVNKAAENVVGLSQEELIGKPFIELDLFPEEEISSYWDFFSRLIKGEHVEIHESKIIDKNGEIRWLDTQIAPIKKKNKIDSVLVICSDVTARKIAEDKIKASLKEKETLLQEIHHRVKNNLQIISSLLNLQSSYIKDEEALDVFKESQNRVKSMAMIHEKLYQSKDFEIIDFADYVQSLATELFASYGVGPNVKLYLNVDQISFNITTAIPCGLIINELLTNSVKHAFSDGRSGEISIELHPFGDEFMLIISDDGIGFPEDLDFKNPKTLGLVLVRNLVKQLNGEIELDRSNRTEFKIFFKELKYKKRT